jgi:hypothetical protein
MFDKFKSLFTSEPKPATSAALENKKTDSEPKPATSAALENKKIDNSLIPKDALEIKADLVKDLASKMGITNTANLTSTMQGGVPTSINGTPVPANLYTEEQTKMLSMSKQLATLVAPKTTNPAIDLTSNVTESTLQQRQENEELRQKDLIAPAVADNSSTQVLQSLAQELGKMTYAFEEMIDYMRSIATNTKNTFHAVQ